MVVTTDDHIFSPFVLDPGVDSLVYVLVEVVWYLTGRVNSYKHAFHLDYNTILDSLSSEFCRRAGDGHLRLFCFELDFRAPRVFGNVKFDQISEVRSLACEIAI